jgi:hypothetical protein
VAPIRQARRAQRASQITKKAYGIQTGRGRRIPIRYELLGDSVALLIVAGRSVKEPSSIKLAKALPDGRVKRMLKESRIACFGSVKEQIAYSETLYQKYGDP